MSDWLHIAPFAAIATVAGTQQPNDGSGDIPVITLVTAYDILTERNEPICDENGVELSLEGL